MEVIAREQADVVLLDLSMPEMDGLTTLADIRRATPASRVIVLSAFGTERTVAGAVESGADEFLHKGADLLVTVPAAIRKAVSA